jgi:hypothetical protein
MSGGCICFELWGQQRGWWGMRGAPTETVHAKAGSRQSLSAGRWQIITPIGRL